MTQFASQYLLPPVSLVVLLSLAVLWLAAGKRRSRSGLLRSLSIALAVLALISTVPAVPKILSLPLGPLVSDWDEQGRPPVGAVVVPTGGSFEDSTGRRWPTYETVRRVALGAALAEEAGLRLAVSGGSPEQASSSEAALAVDFLGLDQDAVLLDTRARNTHENALAFSQLLDPLGIRDVVVVTNKVHMARMSASLRANGFRVYGHGMAKHLDAPLEMKDLAPSNQGLSYMHQIASGYAGILYYMARGRFSVSDLLGSAQTGDSDMAAD